MTELRREDIIQMAQMAVNQDNLIKGQEEIIRKLDRMEQRLGPLEYKMLSIGSLAGVIASTGISLLIAKLKLSL